MRVGHPAGAAVSEEAPLRYWESESDQARIAYRFSGGDPPTVVFLCGYASDMSGTKARYLEGWCRRRGHGFLRFDYRGHGASSGRFEEGTVGAWTDDAVGVIQGVTNGPLVLVGSSMGGWIMLLAGLRLRARTAGLVGIASAPDFTEDMLWPGLSSQQRREIEQRGVVYIPTEYGTDPYPVTSRLVQEARRHLLLRAPIDLTCPVRLLHGMDDVDVPWQTSLRIAERLASRDVRLTLVKGGGHRLSAAPELELIASMVAELLQSS